LEASPPQKSPVPQLDAAARPKAIPRSGAFDMRIGVSKLGLECGDESQTGRTGLR